MQALSGITNLTTRPNNRQMNTGEEGSQPQEAVPVNDAHEVRNSRTRWNVMSRRRSTPAPEATQVTIAIPERNVFPVVPPHPSAQTQIPSAPPLPPEIPSAPPLPPEIPSAPPLPPEYNEEQHTRDLVLEMCRNEAYILRMVNRATIKIQRVVRGGLGRIEASTILFNVGEKTNEDLDLFIFHSDKGGFRRSVSKATKCYQKAANLGHVEAQFKLGIMYLDKKIVRYRPAFTSKNEFLRHERLEDLEDINFVKFSSLRYKKIDLPLKGAGVVKNSSYTAANWFKKAANLGHVEAQFYLGVLYRNGEGVRRNLTEAAKWYQKAAEQGHSTAQNNLGLLYLEGENVEGIDYRTDRDGVKWFSVKAEGCDFSQNHVLAVESCKKAAEQGNTDAQFNLGLMYEIGRGVPKSDELAIEWYLESAVKHNSHALSKVIRLYKKIPTLLNHPKFLEIKERDNRMWRYNRSLYPRLFR